MYLNKIAPKLESKTRNAMNSLKLSLKTGIGILVVALWGVNIQAAPKSIYDFSVKSNSGEQVALSQYKNKVLLVVNTASRCGYTSQYAGLQTIYDRYRAQGFEVLAFPSNDFGQQEPGTSKEIKEFCEMKYKVKFPLFEKNSVKGAGAQPLYAWLTQGQEAVGWNFEKFLITKQGKVASRFKSSVEPESPELIRAIEAELKK